jgi:hypothetical protein
VAADPLEQPAHAGNSTAFHPPCHSGQRSSVA